MSSFILHLLLIIMDLFIYFYYVPFKNVLYAIKNHQCRVAYLSLYTTVFFVCLQLH